MYFCFVNNNILPHEYAKLSEREKAIILACYMVQQEELEKANKQGSGKEKHTLNLFQKR